MNNGTNKEEDYEELSDSMIVYAEKYSVRELLQIVADVLSEVEE